MTTTRRPASLAPRRRCWRTTIASLAALIDPPLNTPLALFTAAPAQPEAWPSNLPNSATIRALYDLFDGGFLGGVHFFSRHELVQENTWVAMLPGVEAGRHLILGTDPRGAPLMWDAHTDAIETLDRSGDLLPVTDSLDAFLDALCNPEPTQCIWIEALSLVEML